MGEISTALLTRGVRPTRGPRRSRTGPLVEDDGPPLSLRQARWVVFLDHVDWPTRRARERVGRHPDQHIRDLRSHFGCVAGRRRRDELRPVAAAACWRGGRPVPGHSVRRAGRLASCWRVRSPAPCTICLPVRSTCAPATSAIRFRCARAISSASWRNRST